MKKFVITAVAAAMMSVSAMAANEVTVFSNGNEVADKGVIIEGRTLVPVRGVFEYMGYSVEWDNSSKTATLTSSDNNTVITLTNGKNTFEVNNKEITPDVPQQIIDGRFMLPLRAVGEAVDAEVQWDNDTKTAKITKENINNNTSDEKEDKPEEFAIPGVSIVEIDPFSDSNMTEIDVSEQ